MLRIGGWGGGTASDCERYDCGFDSQSGELIILMLTLCQGKARR